jgi:signal transduction histidine kinase
MKRAWLNYLRRRWDYEVDPGRQVPFERVVDRINLHRLEPGLIACLARELIAIGLNVTDRMMLDGWIAVASVPVIVTFIVVGQRLRRSDDYRAQRNMLLAAIAFALYSTQLAVAVMASNGRITTAYPETVLAIALFLVLSPRTLVLMLGPALIPYILVIALMPTSVWEKFVTGLDALLATGVAIGAGSLVYAARERDHAQRLVIHRQNAQLLTREREMDELMALTAHDLRSPLLGLRNLFQLAEVRVADDPALPVKILAEGVRSLGAMLNLVERLLQVHQAEQDPGQPAIRDDLRLHLSAAVTRIGPLALASHITVTLEMASRPIYAMFDPAALAQILDNLLANAVRFSPEGETIFAFCRCEDDCAVIVIEDRGPGISEEELPFLFQKFRRGKGMPRAGHQGTGIGLFIASTLAARIGATIRYNGASPNGAVFKVSIPNIES